MLEQSYYEKADEIIGVHGAKPSALIPIIQDIQSEYRYLPPELLRMLPTKSALQKQRLTAWLLFMRTFRLSQRAGT